MAGFGIGSERGSLAAFFSVFLTGLAFLSLAALVAAVA
jgi:hypothetical protein